jgi:hypothetical protein
MKVKTNKAARAPDALRQALERRLMGYKPSVVESMDEATAQKLTAALV